MLPVFASWLVLYWCFTVYGIGAAKLLNIDSRNPVLLLLTGMIAQSFLLTVTALFCRIGIEVFIVNSIITIAFTVLFRKSFSAVSKNIRRSFAAFTFPIKVLFGIIFFMTVFKAAQLPFIVDNDTYYLQSIKWLNEYGFVKGIANLHPFFGQASPWHALQAGFDFSFTGERVHSLNGLLFVCCIFYFFSKALDYKKWLWISLVPVAMLVLYPFISAPSADLPVILITLVIFSLFVEERADNQNSKFILLGLLFIIFIKVTVLPLALLGIILVVTEKKNIALFCVPSIFFGFVWLAKNYITSGYLFFPFDFIPLHPDWKVPSAIMEYQRSLAPNEEFMRFKGYASFSWLQRLVFWLLKSGMASVINAFTAMSFLVFPFTFRFRKESKWQYAYFCLLLHFLIMLYFSPQFRFYLPETVFFMALLMEWTVSKFQFGFKQTAYALSFIVLFSFILPFMHPFEKWRTNSISGTSDHFSIELLWKPYGVTAFPELQYETVSAGNLSYSSPPKTYFLYLTADGPLPCTNEKLLLRNERKFGFIPQMRSKDLANGFYSTKK